MFFCNGKNGMCDEKSCTKNYDLCEYYSGNGGETLESGNEKTQCTGLRCPMQVGYKVDECDYKDCPYRTEPMTNAQKIRAMSDEELAKILNAFTSYFDECNRSVTDIECHDCELFELCGLWKGKAIEWLQQPAE